MKSPVTNAHRQQVRPKTPEYVGNKAFVFYGKGIESEGVETLGCECAVSSRTRLGMERKACREGGTGTELRSRVANRSSFEERRSCLREVAKKRSGIFSVVAGAIES